MWFNPSEFIYSTNRAKVESTYNSFFRNGLLIDTEMLYLLIVGNYDAIEKTNFITELGFDEADYENLRRFLNSLSKISNFYITPHVFTKFVHLLWEKIKDKQHYHNIADLFMSNFSYIGEKYISKDKILEMEHFKTKYCDLCNASLILTSEIHSHNSVITGDKKFANICEERGNILVVYYPDIRTNIISNPQD